MGSIYKNESVNEKLREEIENVYCQIDELDRIIKEYPETDFISYSMKEQSFLEKILPSKKINQ